MSIKQNPRRWTAGVPGGWLEARASPYSRCRAKGPVERCIIRKARWMLANTRQSFVFLRRTAVKTFTRLAPFASQGHICRTPEVLTKEEFRAPAG
jgi:hypothetical protein